ncbi:hypothetical protein EIN_273200 [Entamoeba invadens IP1]|uniref:Uncharacterized protein n=1 Tax=Entamoeba invadens IP1 TaxID=370355 RepID=A0A0A1U4K0_ENTIV|nr:hypothetical protein EIN_273200 [Entamoeba invadens IP1]ELP87803.1 hypothetical protein EIN_273200 [Entamoeba invadens IP1]|eukprot:XP_004254574.1 hypothetical protein EIN_273200 [Entamoeba invadens IP1]
MIITSIHMLFITSLFELVESQDKNTKVCMIDFGAVDMDTNEKYLAKSWDCYDRIPNSKTEIFALNLDLACYIHENMMFLHKASETVNRCGQWIQIIGPSQSQMNCMIAGYRNYERPTLTVVKEERLISVTPQLFTSLTGGFVNQAEDMTQVTVSFSDIGISATPTLFVLNRTETEVNVQIVNTNKVQSMLALGRVSTKELLYYNKNLDDTFTLPLFNENIYVSLIDLNSENINIDNINLATGNRYVSGVRFEQNKIPKCKFFTETQVFEEGSTFEDDMLFKWYILHTKMDGLGKIYDSALANIVLNIEETETKLSFFYSIEILMNNDFREFIFKLRTTNLEGFELKRADLILTKNYLQTDKVGSEYTEQNLKTKMTINKTSGEVKIRALFSKNIMLFSNTIAFVFGTSKGSQISIGTSHLIRSDIYVDQPDCDSMSFDCERTDCLTFDNDTIEDGPNPFTKECRPACGTCFDVFKCSTSGKCVKEKVINLRSNGFSIFSLLFLILLALFL